jgi:mannose-6-phosphate isomerase
MDDAGCSHARRTATGAVSLPAAPTPLAPAPFARPWGAGRFGELGGGKPIGELWISGDDARLPDGRTLAACGLAAGLPLVKLLDVGGALSVQVHPDDVTARELRGAAAVGKHECWVVLDAPSGAMVAIGLTATASVEDLFSGDETRILAALHREPVVAGTVLDIPPGTVHAPGGGLVIYEIQQRSDLTFRIWDWGRPRPLHVAESRRSIRPGARPHAATLPTEEGLSRVSQRDAPFLLRSCVLGETVPSAEVALDRPGVVTVTRGTLEVEPVGATQAGLDRAGPPAARLEDGSHWLLPSGRWRLRGSGSALIASVA